MTSGDQKGARTAAALGSKASSMAPVKKPRRPIRWTHGVRCDGAGVQLRGRGQEYEGKLKGLAWRDWVQNGMRSVS